MREIPLYLKRPRSPVETCEALAHDGNCRRCSLAASCRGPVPPEWTGGTGGVLVVSDYPGGKEDAVRRPMVGATGQMLRPLVKSLWSGPIAIDNAVKCAPGKVEFPERTVAACRPYLAKTVKAAKPSKVLAMGRVAIHGLLGRAVRVRSVRRGYGWLTIDGELVPVYLFPNPVEATKNRFLRRTLQRDLEWALHEEPPYPPAWDGVAKIVTSADDAAEALADARAAGWVAFDVETCGRQWEAHQIVCAAIAPRDVDYAYVWGTHALADPARLDGLLALLRDRAVGKTGANIKYDQLSVRCAFNAIIRGVRGDNRLLRRLISPEADGDLETMAELVGMGGHKEEAQEALIRCCKTVASIAESNVSNQGTLFSPTAAWPGLRRDVLDTITPDKDLKAYAYGFLPEDLRSRYCALDSISSARLEDLLSGALAQEEPGLQMTYDRIVMPAAEAVRQIEEWGVAVDPEAVSAFKSYLEIEIQDVKWKLEAHAWKGFDPNSDVQVRKLLYHELGLPCEYETATGLEATHKDALKALRHLHPAAELMVEYRHLNKMHGTYAENFMRHLKPDGRIHPNILLDGARSGRPSCTDPNLMNIPREADSAEGKMARDCFIAPPGYQLVQGDFSQMELRIAAMLSGDPVMTQIFKDGVDFHQRTAELVSQVAWGIPPEQVQKKHRSGAKAVNFGVLYGLSDTGLAAQLGTQKSVAARIRQAIMGRFSVLDRWCKKQLQQARKTGYCWTWWDGQQARRRPLWQIAEHDGKLRSTAENSAVNSPIQGTASDYCIRSLAEIVDWVLGDGLPAKVVLTVYDSIILEVREDALDEVLSGVYAIMTSWNSKDVPIVVDLEAGPAWGSMEKVCLPTTGLRNVG